MRSPRVPASMQAWLPAPAFPERDRWLPRSASRGIAAPNRPSSRWPRFKLPTSNHPTPNVKKVLLIATTTGYQIRSFAEAAAALGVKLVFASDRCDQLEDPWWDQAIPVRFHDEDASIEAVVSAFDGSRPDGIVAVGDRPTLLAARVGEAFGLAGNPPQAAAASGNKLVTRTAFRMAGLPTPWFEAVSIDADPRNLANRLAYPVVVKPLALSGSRGVMRADSAAAFVAVFERLRRLLDAPDVRIERQEAHEIAMIESFIPGREYAVEGL